jgi:L-seryl-tRNA(Ser) seleniumtransferase
MGDLRALPSVDQLLKDRLIVDLISQFGRPAVREAIREGLETSRKQFVDTQTVPDRIEIIPKVEKILKKWFSPTLIPVINATGVILHTNLGRAPLSKAAIDAIKTVSESYSTLEYDLIQGQRGTRSIHTESLLTRITSAEAALVVNNNAAALQLVLTALANRKRVIISRSQLIEIGGSFRIPEIMAQSGARLVEVGTTNQVHIEDYQKEMEKGASAVLHAHHSNFMMIGFTSEPSLTELSEITRPSSTLLIEDLGSGALIATERFGLGHEITVQEAVSSGADVVCFSGDKLLGGPQAGIIVGKKELIDKIKKHPFARVVRADKICLAGLSATLQHYLKDEADREIPIWQMIAQSIESVRSQAEDWTKELGLGEVLPSHSAIGGGSLPGETIPTFVLGLNIASPNQFLKQLRQLTVPIIARIENNRVVFDPRTILEAHKLLFITQLKTLLKN